MVRSARVGAGVLFAAAFALLTPPASAQTVATFSNTTPIVINDNAAATPYPSLIAVSGLVHDVVKVRVTLQGMTHSLLSDVSVWLLAPNGRSVLLLGRLPGANVTNMTLEFDDCAPRTVPRTGVPTSGRYRPSLWAGTLYPNVVKPAAVTTFPVLTLSGLTGSGPQFNGNWSLYVGDFHVGDTGTIAGWSLTIYTRPAGPGSRGENGTDPACGKPDYDGDGRSDVGVYRPTSGEWFVMQSSTNTGAVTTWGAPAAYGTGDTAVPGDYDGDGQTDIAIYRETTGTWYLRYSFGGTAAIDFGAPSALGLADAPVPGDYDGDGITDLAIYRAGTGQWIIRNSNGSGMTVQTWGAPGLGDYPARR